MGGRKVSVGEELHMLALAVEGIGLLVRQAVVAPEEEPERLLPMLEAMLAMIAGRLREFERVVRGEADVTAFQALHNGVDDDGDTVDILLGGTERPRRT